MKLYDDQIILVTGGAGFIGSGVVRYLNDVGLYNIVVCDELGHTEKWKNLVGKRFIDVVPKDQLFRWLEGRETAIEAIVHLGACSSTVETNADYLLENNYRFSVRLAEYALNNRQRFIYASSAATYGDGSRGFADDESALEKLEPLNMYGYSKDLFDLWAKNEGVLDRIVGLKYFNVFGPNEYHKGRMASVILSMVSSVQKESVIKLFKSTDPIYPDGGQQRDFIYVKDAVRMTCAFLLNDVGGIYNVGTGIGNTWNAIAKAVFDALGKPEKIQYIDMPPDLVGKYQNYTCADMQKTTKVLKDKAKTMPLHESVVEYVGDYIVPGKRW